jgi:Ca-activated chloride channel family protein
LRKENCSDNIDNKIKREFDVVLEKPDTIDRDLAFACSVVEFGMDLRNSEFKGDTSYETIKDLLSKSDIQDKDRSEFVKLVDKYYKDVK